MPQPAPVPHRFRYPTAMARLVLGLVAGLPGATAAVAFADDAGVADKAGDAGVAGGQDKPCRCAPAKPAKPAKPPAAGPATLPAVSAAEHVLEARVTAITPAITGAGAGRSVHELRVVRTWKGAYGERLRLRAAASPDACGYRFAAGETYLIFAVNADEAATGAPGPSAAPEPPQPTTGAILDVDICEGTLPVGSADAVLAGLGAGVVPVDASPEGVTAVPQSLAARPAKGGCAGCRVGGPSTAWGARSAAGGLLALGLVVSGRRQRRRRRAGH